MAERHDQLRKVGTSPMSSFSLHFKDSDRHVLGTNSNIINSLFKPSGVTSPFEISKQNQCHDVRNRRWDQCEGSVAAAPDDPRNALGYVSSSPLVRRVSFELQGRLL